MSQVLLLLATLFPRKVVYELLLKLLEWAVSKTDNTLDDGLYEIIKRNFDSA